MTEDEAEDYRQSDSGALESQRTLRIHLRTDSGTVRAPSFYKPNVSVAGHVTGGNSYVAVAGNTAPLGAFTGARSPSDRRSEDVAGARQRKLSQVAPEPLLPARQSLDSAANRRSSLPPAATPVGDDWATSPARRAAERKSAAELSMVCREIDLLCRLQNDCVVNFHEYFVSPSGSLVHIVLELLRGGSLADEIAARHPGRGAFDEKEARIVAKRLLNGLVFLHEHGCVHRDLKLENLLLKEPGNLDTVTIADFGFAKRLLETQGGARGSVTPNSRMIT